MMNLEAGVRKARSGRVEGGGGDGDGKRKVK